MVVNIEFMVFSRDRKLGLNNTNFNNFYSSLLKKKAEKNLDLSEKNIDKKVTKQIISEFFDENNIDSKNIAEILMKK